MDISSIILLLMLIPLYRSYKVIDNINKAHKEYINKINRLEGYKESFYEVWQEFQSFAPMKNISIIDSRIEEGYDAFSVTIKIQTRTNIIERCIIIRTTDNITIHQLISSVFDIKGYNNEIDELNLELSEMREMEIINE